MPQLAVMLSLFLPTFESTKSYKKQFYLRVSLTKTFHEFLQRWENAYLSCFYFVYDWGVSLNLDGHNVPTSSLPQKMLQFESQQNSKKFFCLFPELKTNVFEIK